MVALIVEVLFPQAAVSVNFGESFLEIVAIQGFVSEGIFDSDDLFQPRVLVAKPEPERRPPGAEQIPRDRGLRRYVAIVIAVPDDVARFVVFPILRPSEG